MNYWFWTRFLIALLAGSPSIFAQNVPVIEEELSNGMRLLMVQRNDEPSVSGGWVAHVGSVNEHPGITGIAHLFEHMMFKGTPTIGTKDHEQDLKIIAEQERLQELIRLEHKKMREAFRRGELDSLTSPESKSDKLRELEKQFQETVEQQRQLLVKNEFSRLYTREGASGMNAFTSHDMTGYFITVPANKLELWAWMESERLLNPVFREFYAERDVVMEERRMRTESTPLGRFEEQLESMFWISHPYHWPVIGWPSDLRGISKAQADDFYARYYSPQNITLILVGDLNPDNARATVERYFGRIPKSEKSAEDVVTLEIEQQAEMRMYAQADANPQVDILWHTVPFGHEDSYPLEVLSQLLSMRTGRLYQNLILNSKVATSTWAHQDSRKYAGLFNIGAEVAQGHTPAELEAAIEAELEKLRNDLISQEELIKIKNNFAAYEYRKLSSNFSILIQLISYDGLGNWREINEAGPKYQAVTAEDIQRVVKTYFGKDNRTVATYTRK